MSLLKRYRFSTVVGLVFSLIAVSAQAADVPKVFMASNVHVTSITVCTYGCPDTIPYVSFTVSETPPELCQYGASISFPLVVGAWGSQTSIPQSKLFLSMLMMSKVNGQPLDVWYTVAAPDVPTATMPQVSANRYCNATLNHLGFN